MGDAAERLAPLLAELVKLVETRNEKPEPRYYDQHDAPCGKRPFLKAVRAGKFAAFKRGPRILALRADVHAWIESDPVVKLVADAKADATPGETPTNEQLLAMNGILLEPPVARVAPARRRRGG